MAQRGIREVDGKKLLARHINNYTHQKFSISDNIVLITKDTDTKQLLEDNPFLKENKLVAKPDVLIGKRGKNNLLLLDASYEECLDFINEKRKSTVTVGNVAGILDDFMIEPFVKHDVEYYVAIKTNRDHDSVFISDTGGIDVEENWGRVKEIKADILKGIDAQDVLAAVSKLNIDEKGLISEFIVALYRLFVDFDFAYLEINPFTIAHGKIIPLDLVAKLDDAASFKQKWGNIGFPDAFGTHRCHEEAYIKSMDEKTGASLKLTVLNPKGRVWTMVAGGGASVIYADTIVDLGFSNELANYGEYSGNPNTEETYEYAKTVLDLMTREKDHKGRPKVLLIGGGIANFTDVAKTFKGIVTAIEDYKDKLKSVDARIYVRRGGPNYQQGLKIMRELGEKVGVPIQVYGPETHMTRIVKMALEN